MAKRTQVFDPRQNMSEKTFEVFHNYDALRRDVDLHHHDFYELYYFMCGDVEYRVEGKSYTLESGDLLLISPNVFHQPVVQPGTPYERIVLWIDRSYLAQLAAQEADLAACFSTAATLLRPDAYQRTNLVMLLEQLCKECRSKKFASSLYSQGLFLQIMVQINRMALRTAQADAAPEEPGLVDHLLSYIGAHYSEKLTLQALAEQFYVSKYHLAHAFSSQVGTSIYRYIMLKRLLAAREQLADGAAPSQVYQACGFQDYANFYRAFKAEYGISPKAYADTLTMRL